MVMQPLKGAVVTTINKLKGTVEEDTLKTQVSVYFDVIQDHSVSLQSQITDNWMENNTAIADHITNNPTIVTVRGISGEMVYIPSTTEGVLDNLYTVANFGKLNKTGIKSDKLTVIPQLLPPVDNITQLAKNAITYAEASANRYKAIIKNFINIKSTEQRTTRLQGIYQKLMQLRENKQALTIQTPYETFGNMYIQSLALRQGDEGFITDIEITLKQAYFTETMTTETDKEVLAQYNGIQRASVENHGKVQGPKKSLAARIYDGDKFSL